MSEEEKSNEEELENSSSSENSSSTSVKEEPASEAKVEKKEETVFFLRCSLESKEAKLFKAKLQLLQIDYVPKDMLSFVIMADNFHEDSDYVRKGFIKSYLKFNMLYTTIDN